VRDDVILIHAPSVFDFRERRVLYGPISDVIPSSSVFEMYPVGFLTMAAYLRRHGYRVRIVNLALLMMRSRRFQPEKLLRKLRPKLFGIDLHWLPHAHGATALATLLKKLHPDIPIVFGGISSSYFHEELIRDPAVDFVLRGSVTEPALLTLVRELENGRAFGSVPGLTWKSPAGEVHVNAPACPPPSLDDYTLGLGSMIRSVLSHLDFWTSIPFHSYWRHPITAVFTVRGCRRNCVSCGASRSSFRRFMPGSHPLYRSPEAIASMVSELAGIARAPIFLVGDIRDGGATYATEVLAALARKPVANRIIFEFFDPPSAEFLQHIDRSVKRWGAELSPESHDPAVRAVLGKATFTNEEMDASIQSMLALRCEQLDLFYMVGLPQQTYRSVQQTVDSIERLFRRHDARLSAFITPMAPFIDPGSDGFENAERHGYRIRTRTLAGHRALLEQPDWESTLNYETEWMTRREIVEATYTAAERLKDLKLRYGRIARRSMKDKDELFPSVAFLRSFRLGGILRAMLR
jgi:B12-binding domain/radical SAM domain protein